MTRQQLLPLLTFFCMALFGHVAIAKPPTDNVYVVPSPGQESKPVSSESPNVETNNATLDSEAPTPRTESTPPLYHLKPSPSVTLALSRAFEVSDRDHSGWLGIHVAPWMGPTWRTQIGLDIHNNLGWLQFAFHSLPTRNLYRFYYGGGMSILMDGREELRDFLRAQSYHAFGCVGSELQLLMNQNVRFELSFHQGNETSFAKATLGYTFLFDSVF